MSRLGKSGSFTVSGSLAFGLSSSRFLNAGWRASANRSVASLGFAFEVFSKCPEVPPESHRGLGKMGTDGLPGL